MKLREHPGMSYRGLVNWPPVWTRNIQGDVETTRGEVGVLDYVYANAHISNKCFLVIRHQDKRFVGCLIFTDRAFCGQMSQVLRQQVGRTIQDIGDLDLTYTL
jgi:hypothetical protein